MATASIPVPAIPGLPLAERFFRRCREHPSAEVVEQPNARELASPVEWCTTGHRTRRWAILDRSTGKIIGFATGEGGGRLLPGVFEALQPAPEEPRCKNGHTGLRARHGRRGYWCPFCNAAERAAARLRRRPGRAA